MPGVKNSNTIEPGTVFAKQTLQGADFQSPPDDAAEMYDVTNALMAEAGLPLGIAPPVVEFYVQAIQEGYFVV